MRPPCNWATWQLPKQVGHFPTLKEKEKVYPRADEPKLRATTNFYKIRSCIYISKKKYTSLATLGRVTYCGGVTFQCKRMEKWFSLFLMDFCAVLSNYARHCSCLLPCKSQHSFFVAICNFIAVVVIAIA